MKKILSLLLVFTLILSFSFIGEQSFATGNIEDITFENGTMFSVGLGVNENFTYTAKGLVKDSQGNYQKVDILDPQNITWTISNSSILEFVGSASGETIAVRSKAEGESKVIAHYNGMSVHSNVFVETGASFDSVENITVKIIGEQSDNFIQTIPHLVNFSLKDVYGPNYDDSGIKKNKVTAMHALLWALEEYYDEDGNGISDGWDWVRDNVAVGYNGSFVSKIGPDVNYGQTGWMYKMKPTNAAEWEFPMVSASQCELEDGYQEKWGFATWGDEW